MADSPDLDAMLDDAFDQVKGTEDKLEAALDEAVTGPGGKQPKPGGVPGLEKDGGDVGRALRRADVGIAFRLPPAWEGIDEDVQMSPEGGGAVWVSRYASSHDIKANMGPGEAMSLMIATVEDTRSGKVDPKMFAERMRHMAMNPPLPPYIAARSKCEFHHDGPKIVGPFAYYLDYTQRWAPGPGPQAPDIRFSAWISVLNGVAYSVQMCAQPSSYGKVLPQIERVVRGTAIQLPEWKRGIFDVQAPSTRIRIPLCDLALHPVEGKPRAAVRRVAPSDLVAAFECPAGEGEAPFGLVVCRHGAPADGVEALPHTSGLSGVKPGESTHGGVKCSTMTYDVPPECRGTGVDCVAAWRSGVSGDVPVAVAWNKQPKEMKEEDHDALVEFMAVMRGCAVDAAAGSVDGGAEAPTRFEQPALGFSFAGGAAADEAGGSQWMGKVQEMRYGDVKLVYRPVLADPTGPEMQVIEPFTRPGSLDEWVHEMLTDLESGDGKLMSNEKGQLSGEQVATVVGKADLPPEEGSEQQGPQTVVLTVTLVWRGERPFMLRWACKDAVYSKWRERMARVTASFQFSAPAPAAVAPEAPAPVAHADPAGSPPPRGSAVAGMAAQRVAALQSRKPKGKATSPSP